MGARSPQKKDSSSNTKKETEVSLRLITFVLLMYKQLTSEQRYAISVLLQSKKSKKEIASAIGVHISTVYRELRRNVSKRGYSWCIAQEIAQERRERLPGNRSISVYIKRKAIECLKTSQWSPEQISGKLKPDCIYISHETIYKIIRKDKADGGQLYTHCRHKLKHRKRPVGGKKIPIPDRITIHERPQQADGSRFGDWEMDTIIGKNEKRAILTLTERKTNFILMEKLKHGKKATELAKVVIRLLYPYKNSIHTITTDNGTEFAAHKLITEKLGATVYFADPYSSWQKGAIEHANKLIRQYIPKESSFEEFNDMDIRELQYKLNLRPRKKLNFDSPKNQFFKHLL